MCAIISGHMLVYATNVLRRFRISTTLTLILEYFLSFAYRSFLASGDDLKWSRSRKNLWAVITWQLDQNYIATVTTTLMNGLITRTASHATGGVRMTIFWS